MPIAIHQLTLPLADTTIRHRPWNKNMIYPTPRRPWTRKKPKTVMKIWLITAVVVAAAVVVVAMSMMTMTLHPWPWRHRLAPHPPPAPPQRQRLQQHLIRRCKWNSIIVVVRVCRVELRDGRPWQRPHVGANGLDWHWILPRNVHIPNLHLFKILIKPNKKTIILLEFEVMRGDQGAILNLTSNRQLNVFMETRFKLKQHKQLFKFIK